MPRNLYRRRMLSRITPFKNRIENSEIHLTNEIKNINKNQNKKVWFK